MTLFQDDNGNEIIIEDDLQLYKSSVNLFDFTIKGNFSTSFQVPNNSFYKKSFQYFTPLQLPPNGFKATIFNMVKNGNVIERGQLILEREDNDYLYFFFVSGNSNWIVLIPDISVKDIDYDDFTFSNNGEGIINLNNSASGFCYPFIDWGYHGIRLNTNYEFFNDNHNIIVDTSYDLDNGFPEFYPCFFLKSVLQEIFKYCQLKIGGNILTDSIYQQMIITPEAGQIQRANKFLTDRQVTVSPLSNSSFAVGGTKINLNNVIQNGNLLCWDSINVQYIANKACNIEIDYTLNVSQSAYITLDLYKNGSFYASYSNQCIEYPNASSCWIPNAASTQLTNTTNKGKMNNNLCNGTLLNTPTPRFVVDVVKGDTLQIYANFGGNYKGTTSGTGHPGSSNPGDTWTISSGGLFGSIGDTVTVFIGDIVQALTTNSSGASQWAISHIAAGFNVLPQTQITFQPSKELNRPYASPTNVYDVLRASDILPDMKLIDLIKFISQYFCAIPTYDSTTGTVYFNKLDSFDYTQALNWSEFLQKFENNYQIQTAKYNYARFKQLQDGLVNSLGSGHNLKYGEALIQGQSSTKVNNDLLKIPFGASLDKIGFVNQILSPWIDLIDIEFDGDAVPITSIIKNGATPQALFNLGVSPNWQGGTGVARVPRQLFLIYGTVNYDGYVLFDYFVSSNQVTFFDVNYNATNTGGFIQPLKFTFKTDQSRILFFAGSQSISNFANGILNLTFGITNYSSFGYTYFSKPNSSFAVSSFKQGLNLDYYIGNYTDVPRRLEYYKNLTRILNSPYVKAWFYLPEAVYASFNFGNFVYLKDEEQQRYYWVDSIENYKDSKTLVQVNLLLLS